MIKKILKSVREFKKASILTPIYVSLEVVMEVFIPMLMAVLIDKGIEAGNMGMIGKIGALLAVMCILSLTFGTLSGKYAAKAMAGFSRNLRHDMFHKVQSFSFANIDRFSSASIVTRMTTDVMMVQNAYQMIIRIAVRGPLMMLFSLIMAFTVNVKLSLVFLCTIPVLTGGLLLIASHAHPIFEKMFKVMDKMNRVVQENLRGVRVVKSFVRQDHEIEKFQDTSDEVYHLNAKAERLLALNSPLMQFCMYACTLLVSFLGAKMIISSQGAAFTTGQLTSLISYASQILMSLMMLSMIYVMITMSRASCERIVEILDEEPDIESPANPVTQVKDGSVDFENVSFSYSKNPDKSLSCKTSTCTSPPARWWACWAAPGSSKSSLVQLIPRLYDATQGSVKVGGVDVRDYDLTALRDSVAMVLQKNELFAGTIYREPALGQRAAPPTKRCATRAGAGLRG